jgi:hypothetical protein
MLPSTRTLYGGVREHQIGTLTLEQSGIIVLIARVATEEAMRTQNPNIALSRDRRRNDRRHIIFRTWSNRRLLGCLIQDRVDLSERETGDLQILELQVQQTLIFDREHIAIPPRKLGNPVVGNDESLFVGLGKRTERHNRNELDAERLCRLQPAMPSDDLKIVCDEDGIGEPEPRDRVGEQLDLPSGVRPRVARVRTQPVGRDVLDGEVVHGTRNPVSGIL